MTNGLFWGCFGHFNMYHHLKEEEKDLRKTALDIAKWPIQFLCIFCVILGKRKILLLSKTAFELCIFCVYFSICWLLLFSYSCFSVSNDSQIANTIQMYLMCDYTWEVEKDPFKQNSTWTLHFSMFMFHYFDCCFSVFCFPSLPCVWDGRCRFENVNS